MTTRKPTRARLLIPIAALGIALFLAACSPTLAPPSTGPVDAASQTVNLVTVLTVAKIGEQPVAATETAAPNGLLFTRATTVPTMRNAVELDASAAGVPCNDAQTTHLVTVQYTPTPLLDDSTEPRHEIDDLTDFLYVAPSGRDDLWRHTPSDGDL